MKTKNLILLAIIAVFSLAFVVPNNSATPQNSKIDYTQVVDDTLKAEVKKCQKDCTKPCCAKVEEKKCCKKETTEKKCCKKEETKKCCDKKK